jgi:hypothetical protein
MEKKDENAIANRFVLGNNSTETSVIVEAIRLKNILADTEIKERKTTIAGDLSALLMRQL